VALTGTVAPPASRSRQRRPALGAFDCVRRNPRAAMYLRAVERL
jgi:hypothetical protein